jgi:hypothetical protein
MLSVLKEDEALVASGQLNAFLGARVKQGQQESILVIVNIADRNLDGHLDLLLAVTEVDLRFSFNSTNIAIVAHSGASESTACVSISTFKSLDKHSNMLRARRRVNLVLSEANVSRIVVIQDGDRGESVGTLKFGVT